MDIQISHEQQDQTHLLRLEGELTAYTAGEVCQALQQALDTGAAVELSMDGVTRCDTAGIQLILSARKTAARAGRSLSVRDCSQALRQQNRLVGLECPISQPDPSNKETHSCPTQS